MEDFSKEKIGEGWVVMKDDTKPIMDDFVFLQGDSANDVLSEIRSISAEVDQKLPDSSSPPKVTINHDALKGDHNKNKPKHHKKEKNKPSASDQNRDQQPAPANIRQSAEIDNDSTNSSSSSSASAGKKVCLTANIVTDDYPH